MTREDIGRVIRSTRIDRNLTQMQVAKAIGRPQTTIASWERGKAQPDADTLFKLFDFFGVSLNDAFGFCDNLSALSVNEKKMIKKYRTLDEHGKRVIDFLLDEEANRCSCVAAMEADEDSVIFFPTDCLNQPASAGTGLYADETAFDVLDLVKRPPRGTTCIVRIAGDSMEPTFCDGDKVFVRAQNVIEPGEIGIFVINGDLFVKEMGDGVLISHNSVYDPIHLNENSRIECQGKVLGKCTDEYFSK